MLKKFNEIYNFPEDTPFKRVELEDAIIEKFGEKESWEQKIRF